MLYIFKYTYTYIYIYIRMFFRALIILSVISDLLKAFNDVYHITAFPLHYTGLI